MDWIDRDLSWLDFNRRVIYQALRQDVPFEERLVFLGIGSSNLDEFVSVRTTKALINYSKPDSDVSNAEKLLKGICDTKKEIRGYYNAMVKSCPELENNIITSDQLTEKEMEIFDEDIFPSLTPIGLGSNKEIPRLNGDDVNFFIKRNEDDGPKYCFLQIPCQLPRVMKVDDKYEMIEDIVRKNLNRIFGNNLNYLLFKVTKFADVELSNDENVSIVDRVTEVVRTREENNIIYLDIQTYPGTDESVLQKLKKVTKVKKGMVNLCAKREFETLGFDFLKDKPFKKLLANLSEGGITLDDWNDKFKPKSFDIEDDMFDMIEDRDILVHHPYESYDAVIRFIEEAARDPSVISIKQTLYRVSSEKSPIIKALVTAANMGKRVTVMLELLARFDEKQNIKLINKLKRSGVNIVYSSSKKTHCKICLVTKVSKKGNLKTYCHIGTGNYNEKSAKIYTDLSLFTSKRAYARDLNLIFNMITGFTSETETSVIWYSPETLRPQLENMIALTIEHKGTVKIKCNALSDKQMVDKIYDAAGKGVKFQILCRGVCSLVPRENIEVHSIVGRFLEHSRIYIFELEEKKIVYMSSADLLTRNLDKRVEVLALIKSKKCCTKAIDIFDSLWLDTANTFVLNNNGVWEKLEGRFNVQNMLTTV